MEQEAVSVRRKKHHPWLIVLIAFIGILGFLVYTSFYNPNLKKTITGGIIKEPLGEIEIDAAISPLDRLKISGNIEKVELKIKNKGFFIGREKFELDEASIIIENYNGNLVINKSYIIIDGSTEKVFVEGIPISSFNNMKILIENAEYNYVRAKGFYLDNLKYKASGIVRLNKEKVLINLENEDFKIEKFRGDLEVRKDSFKIKGIVKKTNLGFIDVRPIQKAENKSSE